MRTAKANGGTGSADATHALDLGAGWTVWRTACVRGAGFPAAMLEALAAPEAAAAADRLFAAEQGFEDARRRAMECCNAVLAATSGDEHKRWWRILKRLSKGRLPDPLPDSPQAAEPFAALARARDEADAARRQAEAAFGAACGRISEAVRAVGRNPRFREALAWQNRTALEDGVDALLRAPPGKRNYRVREHEQLVASYLQRYCAKNETIGFFGPIAWARFTEDGPPVDVRPGPGLIAERKVHIEYWAIDSLARALGQEPALLPWLAPRLDPRMRIDGTVLTRPAGRITLAPAAAAVLAACDGETPAREIAARIAADPERGPGSADQVYAILAQGRRAGDVIWTLEVPVGPDPYRRLRETLDRVADAGLRKRLTAPLDEFGAARDRAAAAAGDAEALAVALGDLDALFTRITDKEPTRYAGRTYAGRTLVYEDCVRDAEIDLGPELRARIGPPLALVLQSARWFSHAVATLFAAHLDRLHAEYRDRYAPDPVAFDDVWSRLHLQREGMDAITERAAENLAARWAPILACEPGARRLHLRAEALRERVAAAFPAPGPGWPEGRNHSPDILIAARSLDDIRNGRFQCVLGEVHVASNLMTVPMCLSMHPRPEDLVAAQQRDRDHPRVFPVTVRRYIGHRKARGSFAPGDLQLAWDDSPPWRPRAEVLRTGDLVIEKEDGAWRVRTRDGTRSFPAAVVFERLLIGESQSEFRIAAAAPHSPRITIDELIVSRESWRFAAGDLAFAREKGEADRFIAARRWARAHDLPRWVFVRLPHEFKPVYVDFDSPPSVEILARLVRRGCEAVGEDAPVAVTEMLPTPDQAWLPDADGNRYASEIRLIAVDHQPWTPG